MIKAFVLLSFVGGTGEHLSWFKETKENMLKIKGISEVHGVFGRWDIVVRVEVDNVDELINVVTDKIRSMPGVQSSETLMMIF